MADRGLVRCTRRGGLGLHLGVELRPHHESLRWRRVRDGSGWAGCPAKRPPPRTGSRIWRRGGRWPTNSRALLRLVAALGGGHGVGACIVARRRQSINHAAQDLGKSLGTAGNIPWLGARENGRRQQGPDLHPQSNLARSGPASAVTEWQRRVLAVAVLGEQACQGEARGADLQARALGPLGAPLRPPHGHLQLGTPDGLDQRDGLLRVQKQVEGVLPDRVHLVRLRS
mmetsp:Transcript_79941/g.248069  ORF Transcript_79941/g.248069 Transcript_79941/m.248069 type:complete len:228 (+) Transcript_79941:386-1069(+)